MTVEGGQNGPPQHDQRKTGMKNQPFPDTAPTRSRESCTIKSSTTFGSLRRRGIALTVAASMAFTSACASGGGGELSSEDKRAIGTIGGALTGAVIGYEYFGGGQGRWLAALVLGVAGAYGGQMLADRLTRFDRTAMKETAYHTLTDAPAGETGAWANPNTGTNGSITPIRTFLDSQGRICREYQAEIQVDGETHTAREAACQTAAGHWVMYATES
jgi:surface antigen